MELFIKIMDKTEQLNSVTEFSRHVWYDGAIMVYRGLSKQMNDGWKYKICV